MSGQVLQRIRGFPFLVRLLIGAVSMAVFGLVLGFILDLIKGTTGWFLPIFMCVGLSIVITAIAFWYNRDQLR